LRKLLSALIRVPYFCLSRNKSHSASLKALWEIPNPVANKIATFSECTLTSYDSHP